jgi:hypothetical protein
MSTQQSRPLWTVFALWLPGVLVALGAATATAHGLFEVAAASGVPDWIAWIYPLITDGLAMVAYVATARLTAGARRYAWAVVILAAGLSGIAQATFLAGGVATADPSKAVSGAAVAVAPDELLRFGVGAWPAVAAAIVAHLLFMLAAEGTPETDASVQPERVLATAVQPQVVQPTAVQPEPLNAPVQLSPPVPEPSLSSAVQPVAPQEPTEREPSADRRSAVLPSPARDRARAAARRHAAHHGDLPTVSQLQEMAEVSRGTAGTALQELREQPAQLHMITDISNARTQP